ncbi:ribosome biogenesis protein, partial [Candidatus Woesearchaeota archaeon]|nr:ribosome biogenesis protein [Candidatus Woesearchaeota archaeon]
MTEKLHFCSSCRQYTLEKHCPRCAAETSFPKPPKFSLEDKYGAYR